jgi:valyl-tRNA synthetase
VAHPLIPGVLLPIVLDSVLVDPAMGTGVVKVTPAHDPADFECSQRHNLPSVNMLNDDGTVNKNVPTQYQVTDRNEYLFLV